MSSHFQEHQIIVNFKMKKLDEINEIMDEIKYGYVDINNEIHPKFDRDIQFKYRLQSPEELKKSKYGVCFDQVELQRALFKGYDFTTYFIVYLKESEKVHTHTFLVYTDNNKYFLYEHAEEIAEVFMNLVPSKISY